MSESLQQSWWESLRHFGMLLSPAEVVELSIAQPVERLFSFRVDQLRREMTRLDAGTINASNFVAWVLDHITAFGEPTLGKWKRQSLPAEYSRTLINGDTLKPSHIWTGTHGGTLPLFITPATRIGLGRGRKIVSDCVQWLRASQLQLALVTNGRQWRLIFAGLDYDAACEWDIDLWFEEGHPGPHLEAFRRLLHPAQFDPAKEGDAGPLIQRILASRRGQSELSAMLGERVREAVELLVRAHGEALKTAGLEAEGAAIYHAAVRVVMRMVVVLFAESRELLPRADQIYHQSYGLQGLFEQLRQQAARGRGRLEYKHGAWPRILALFCLIYEGSHHESLIVPQYGGDLFAPGQVDSPEASSRAIHVFETACFDSQREPITDSIVHRMLELMTQTRIHVRQGRTTTTTMMPVDFSDLSSEYIGILYEGLLDYELCTAPVDDPIVFLAVGNEPALPLSRLEAMSDAQIKDLLEKLKDTSKDDGEEEGDEDESAEADESSDDTDDAEAAATEDEDASSADAEDESADDQPEPGAHEAARARAIAWTLRACDVGGLVNRPRGRITPERQFILNQQRESKARQLARRVVQPGEWYLVRWGGTRKGSGTFYTRPALAVPTVQRTLRPLAYDPPLKPDGQPDVDAPTEQWLPKLPEKVLELTVCDPACGSGSFLVASLRFLTEAVYRGLHAHGRLGDRWDQPLEVLLGLRPPTGDAPESLTEDRLPCRPGDDDFEALTKSMLRRYVVERCLYGVDMDPIAIELGRMALWIETMDEQLPFSFLDHKIKVGNSLVGAWFDQFLHYPAMAWEREGGDKNHTTGVHLEKEAWTKAIKARKAQVKTDLINFIDGATLHYSVDLTTVQTGHDEAEAALAAIHALGIRQVNERAKKHNELRQNAAFAKLKDAFDLWCSLWFWSPQDAEAAPLASEFAQSITDEAVRDKVRRIAAARRFFHWELEFPDVFNARRHGFDAIVGNPPWDISKPASKEFFSAIDPLYRSYGKQEAKDRQTGYFQHDANIEQQWLDYNAYFRGMSNWVKFAGRPFGDRVTHDSNDRPSHDFNLGDRGRSSFDSSAARHAKWQRRREESSGYADAEHSFQHQGSGDINLYKMFLEQSHALLRDDGRLGMITPSGVYSDHGTRALRQLFVDRCRWEWLFGFENRQGIFDIDSRFKFNPVIIQKGGQTAAIRTAFMRRELSDWSQAERFATDYPRARLVQFSPKSLAILEIQSQRDLEVLTKIYANSILLGDQSPDGWGIKYAREFDMTNDSKLFPPRPTWEAWGYQPDEYSRWIKGDWQPVARLWEELGTQPLPEGERRCAQPPYDTLPIARADIPPGIILSRDATLFIREDDIPVVTFTDAAGRPLKIKTVDEEGNKVVIEPTGPAVALPLYQGVAIWQLESCASDYLEGATHSARWQRRSEFGSNLPTPQFAVGKSVARVANVTSLQTRVGFRSVQNATNQRTMISTMLPANPAGNSIGVMRLDKFASTVMPVYLCDFAYDFSLRPRMSQANLNWFILEETPVPSSSLSRTFPQVGRYGLSLTGSNNVFAEIWLRCLQERTIGWRSAWAITSSERMRVRSASDAIALAVRGLTPNDLKVIIKDCDHPLSLIQNKRFARDLYVKDFWRVDKDKHPEHRHTLLTLVALHDVGRVIEASDGDLARGIEAFCTQNNGEGWMLPETLRLADYGLGHDDRAQYHQPVRERFGPRFYDWQLAQDADESWRECELHARNLLGAEGFAALQRQLAGGDAEDQDAAGGNPPSADGTLFPVKAAPLFDQMKNE